jgi:hypothetical protein
MVVLRNRIRPDKIGLRVVPLDTPSKGQNIIAVSFAFFCLDFLERAQSYGTRLLLTIPEHAGINITVLGIALCVAVNPTE